MGENAGKLQSLTRINDETGEEETKESRKFSGIKQLGEDEMDYKEVGRTQRSRTR